MQREHKEKKSLAVIVLQRVSLMRHRFTWPQREAVARKLRKKKKKNTGFHKQVTEVKAKRKTHRNKEREKEEKEGLRVRSSLSCWISTQFKH